MQAAQQLGLYSGEMRMNNTTAIEGIRLFLWDRLKKSGLMKSTDYKRTPLVPVQEAPDFLTEISAMGNPPYIIYNWTTENINQFWMMPSDQMVFLIYSPDMSVINDIVKFMADLFKRFEISAQEVNDYIMKLGRELPGDTVATKASRKNIRETVGRFDYKYIQLTSAGGPLPFDQEAARQEAMVSIRVTYTEDIDEFGMSL